MDPDVRPALSEYPYHPADCAHRNLHERRLDGAHTVCLDCGRHVIVSLAHYANGETETEQAVRLLRVLERAR